MTRKQPRVEVVPIGKAARPDPSNINKHTQRGHAIVENSIRRRGAFRSIASVGKGVDTPVVMAGNLTLEKAVDAGITEVVNVHVTGEQLVNVIRDDIEPGSPQAAALGIEDNEAARKSYNPDIDMLAAMTAGDGALLAELAKDDQVFGSVLDGIMPPQIDYEKEWEGMPEFEREAIAYRSIHIHFRNEQDVSDFARIIEQDITDKTRSLWFPAAEKRDLKSQGYVTDES